MGSCGRELDERQVEVGGGGMGIVEWYGQFGAAEVSVARVPTERGRGR
jgi:hypothetical protein